MSVLITLSRGLVSIIDDDDLERVSQFKWHAGERYGGRFIACANIARGKQIQLHRFIMNAVDGQVVDHIDRDALNNRRANLRFCTHSQNGANRQYKLGISGFRGVRSVKHRINATPRYFAEIKCEYKMYRGERRASAEEAAADYDALALRLFGEYATLNFSSGA